MSGKGARGGKPVKLAAPGGYSGFINADAAWHFFGSPAPPDGLTSSDYFQWERETALKAQQAYSAAGLHDRLCKGLNEEERKRISVSEETWQSARAILEAFIMARSVHDGPRANSDKNDPRSLGHFQEQLRSELDRWTERLAERLEDRRLRELDGLAFDQAMAAPPGDLPPDGRYIQKQLAQAYELLCNAAMAVDQVQIEGHEIGHEAQTRKRFARRLKDLALASGLDGKQFVLAFNIYLDTKSNDGFDVWYQRLNEADD
jgi:hypothetical protein